MHEINHIVDSCTVLTNPALNERRQQLLTAAGNNASNYLRNMFGNDFFVSYPGEFFASISNEWFTDSAKTIELGLKQFDTVSKQPINQALFFAEIYSMGGNDTLFYKSDTLGNITRITVPVTRDEKGRIKSLTFNGSKYEFTLDDNGNVTSYSISK